MIAALVVDVGRSRRATPGCSRSGSAGSRPGIVAAGDRGADRGRRLRRRDRRRHRPALVALFRTLGLSVFQSVFAQGLDERPARQDDQLHGRLRDPRRAADHGADDVQPRRGDQSRRRRRDLARGRSRPGYYRSPGSTWLHRRHPVTKLLGLAVRAARGVPAAAGRLLVLLAGRGSSPRPSRPACSAAPPVVPDPGAPARLDRRRQRPVFPGATEKSWRRSGRSGHPRGPDLRARLGGPAWPGVRAVDPGPVDDAPGRPPRESRGPWREPPDRLRRALGGPARPADAGPCRSDPRRAVGPAGSPSTGSFGTGCARSSRRSARSS